MRGLAGQWENECEHVYTTRHGCVAAQTRPARGVSTLQELTPATVGQRIAALMLKRSRSDSRSVAVEGFRRREPLCHNDQNTLPVGSWRRIEYIADQYDLFSAASVAHPTRFLHDLHGDACIYPWICNIRHR